MILNIMQDGSEQVRYDDPAFPAYVKYSSLTDYPGMTALCHWHEELELLLPLKGSMLYSVNGQVVTIQEGNAIFVNSRQLHYGFSQEGKDCEFLCVVFSPQLLGGNPAVWNRFVLPLVSSPGLPFLMLRKIIPEHRPLLSLLHRMGTLTEEGAMGWELQITACLYQLWQGIFTLAEAQIGEEVSTDANVLIQKKMMEYIRLHYQEKLKVEDIAAAGGVCRTKCWQIFRRYLGQTPNDYLNSFRLEKGMQMLRSTRLSVTEIADQCGFTSASYFTELFTRQKGCPPSKFRRN